MVFQRQRIRMASASRRNCSASWLTVCPARGLCPAQSLASQPTASCMARGGGSAVQPTRLATRWSSRRGDMAPVDRPSSADSASELRSSPRSRKCEHNVRSDRFFVHLKIVLAEGRAVQYPHPLQNRRLAGLFPTKQDNSDLVALPSRPARLEYSINADVRGCASALGRKAARSPSCYRFIDDGVARCLRMRGGRRRRTNQRCTYSPATL
mmetsp:Transcript_20911/g.60897  ORF Transcript_20911/g.60897 Transcript_20911/m.60897 type:complete len:210 (+) Transcript_20911:883-1512(+)